MGDNYTCSLRLLWVKAGFIDRCLRHYSRGMLREFEQFFTKTCWSFTSYGTPHSTDLMVKFWQRGDWNKYTWHLIKEKQHKGNKSQVSISLDNPYAYVHKSFGWIFNLIKGSLNKFSDFFRMGTFIDSTHMKL